MHRTQISLEHEQYQALVRESRKRRMSLSAIIRELVEKGLSSSDNSANPLDRLAGIAEGTGDTVGREHNRFLYDKRDR